MKLVAHILITLLAIAPAIPTYAMHSATAEQMDTADDNGESTTVRRSGRKRKQREISLDSESQATVAKAFICKHSGCGKSFKEKWELKRHKRTHTGEKPFICKYPECSRRFTQKYNLTIHMRIHTREKPHTCTECNKTFRDGSSLKSHEKNHNSLKPFPCPEPGCREYFDAEKGLATHMKTYHRKPAASDATASSGSDIAPPSTSSPATLPLPTPAAESTASPSLLDQLQQEFSPQADHAHIGVVPQAEPPHTALPPLPQNLMWEEYNPEKESLFSLPMPDNL